MRAISAVFTPQEQSRRERVKQVEILANEIGRHIRDGMQPRCVILLAGARLVFAMPGTAKCQRLLGLRSAMLIGTYGRSTDLKKKDLEPDPERIKHDLEATLTEYHEGVLESPARRVGTR